VHTVYFVALRLRTLAADVLNTSKQTLRVVTAGKPWYSAKSGLWVPKVLKNAPITLNQQTTKLDTEQAPCNDGVCGIGQHGLILTKPQQEAARWCTGVVLTAQKVNHTCLWHLPLTGCATTAVAPVVPTKKACICNSLPSLYPALAAEYDTARNGVGPEQVLSKSNKIAFWKDANGHTWEQSPANRTKPEKDRNKRAAIRPRLKQQA